MTSTSCPRTFSQKQYILGFRIPHVLQCRSLSKEKIRPGSKTQKLKWVFHTSKFSSSLPALPPPHRKESRLDTMIRAELQNGWGESSSAGGCPPSGGLGAPAPPTHFKWSCCIPQFPKNLLLVLQMCWPSFSLIMGDMLSRKSVVIIVKLAVE